MLLHLEQPEIGECQLNADVSGSVPCAGESVSSVADAQAAPQTQDVPVNELTEQPTSADDIDERAMMYTPRKQLNVIIRTVHSMTRGLKMK